jgi:hypothetical protein
VKKNSLALVVSALLLAGCGSSVNYQKLRIEIPTYSPIQLDDFEELAVTTFLIPKETAGVDLNKEVTEYFITELARKFKGKVVARSVALDNEGKFKQPAFWKALAAGQSGLLFITGKASLEKETRKAVLSRPGNPREEEFSTQRTIAERTVFTLDASIYMIRADTGEIVLSRDFKETRAYTNPKQRADFAFSDLVQRIKQKLFRPILSEERIEERYLLLK